MCALAAVSAFFKHTISWQVLFLLLSLSISSSDGLRQPSLRQNGEHLILSGVPCGSFVNRELRETKGNLRAQHALKMLRAWIRQTQVGPPTCITDSTSGASADSLCCCVVSWVTSTHTILPQPVTHSRCFLFTSEAGEGLCPLPPFLTSGRLLKLWALSLLKHTDLNHLTEKLYILYSPGISYVSACLYILETRPVPEYALYRYMGFMTRGFAHKSRNVARRMARNAQIPRI